jgi:hypothetical protein
LNPEDHEIEDDMVEKAKQLLLLTDLVDKYPQVVSRRVAGLVYLIIAGGISFATLIFMALQNMIVIGSWLLVNLGFVLISLFFSWLVAFRLVVPLTKSYPQQPEEEGGRGVVVLWGILAIAIILVSVVAFQAGMDFLFFPALQCIMGCGFTANYVFGRRESGVQFYTREHLYFGIAVFLSIFPMLMFPTAAYLFIILVDMGGIYVIGIYMLVTAEKLLLESKGQG